MTRKLSPNSSLSVPVSFLAVLIAFVALAQTTAAGQNSTRYAALSQPQELGAPSPVLADRMPTGVGPGKPTPVNPLRPKPQAAKPMDGTLFLPVVTYETGGRFASSLTAADLNGDGHVDIIGTNIYGLGTCNGLCGLVGVLLGKFDGTFQPVETYDSGGGWAWSVAVGDVNGDGKPDLVVANRDGSTSCPDGSVDVLLGKGDGTFDPAVDYCTGGSTPMSVAVADVNRDGKLDLIVANGNSSNIGVLLGNGDGTFQPALTYDAGYPSPMSILVSDVNKDGNPDLVVGSFYNKVSVLLGNGTGTFQVAGNYDSGGFYVNSIAVSDVNGDGIPDVLVANEFACGGCQNGSVGVLLGNGDGSFQPTVGYSSGGNAGWAVAVADVDGDGKPDLAVVNYSSNSIGVLLGNGDGTFQPAVTYDSGGEGPYAVVLADVNGDTKPDLLVVNWYGNGNDVGLVGVLINNVTTSPTTTSLSSSEDPGGVAQKVTYTATVTGQHGGTLTGTVTFLDEGTPVATIPLANNQAAYTTRYKSIGVHSMTATYSGDANNASSTSPALLESIMESTRTILTTSGSPSKVLQPVTLTATVKSKFGTPPDGELVTFYEWNGLLGSVPLAGGVATYTVVPSEEAQYRMKAVYSGDAVFAASRGGVRQRVEKYDSTTGISSSQDPSQYGQPVTFTVTVSSPGPMPTGFITLYEGKKELASPALIDGVVSVTVSTIKPGKHTIFAIYWSDNYNHQSRSPYLKQYVVR